MLLATLAFIAVILTLTMFFTKAMMLGFPCLIFWALVSAQGYLCSEATWDIYYFVFFGSMGMAIFSGFAMYALREKRDTLGDIDMENESTTYIDEKSKDDESVSMPDDDIEKDTYYSKSKQNLRKRAEQRRINKLRKNNKDSDFIVR